VYVVVFLALSLSAAHLQATTNLVTSLADAGPGSLRQVIADSAAGDTIVFSVTGSVTLVSGELALDKDLQIAGPGSASLTISGNHASRILNVNSGVTAVIAGLTMCDGKAPDGTDGDVFFEFGNFYVMDGGPGEPGGAIYTRGTLTLNDCCVASSAAGNGGAGTNYQFMPSRGGPGGVGGGIYNSGTLTLSNCVLNGNSAGDSGLSGAGVYIAFSWPGGSGGGIYNVGLLRLDNSTISGNIGGAGGFGADGGAGGGIWSSGTCIANRSTLSDNSAGGGGAGPPDDVAGGDGGDGGSGGGVSSAGSLAMTNCTVSGNSCGNGGPGGIAGEGGGAGDGSAGEGGAGGGVWATGSLILVNCTLDSNSSGRSGAGDFQWLAGRGGGVACDSTNSLVNGCTITGNWAGEGGGGAGRFSLNRCTLSGNSGSNGGGAHGSTLNNCVLMGNSASSSGGGAYEGKLNNCTITGNSASYGGGGARVAELRNCIIYYNTATVGPNYQEGTVDYSCTTPLPTTGAGNIDLEPLLASASHLSTASPCRGAGSPSYAAGTDIDGETWASPPSMGCDEYYSGAVTGALMLSISLPYTNLAAGYPVELSALVGGRTSRSVWNFGDGSWLTNQPYVNHAWAAPGDYVVVLSVFNENHPQGVSASITVSVTLQPTHYVSAASTNPTPPFLSWATAATNIQDAVDAAAPGAEVIVANGAYQSGQRSVGLSRNRIVVAKPVKVKSLNGPVFTVIRGYQPGGIWYTRSALRCVYLANGAALSGFTLANGGNDGGGGGVWCESDAEVVTDCVVRENAGGWGGGASRGTLINCTLTNNYAPGDGGGAYGAVLNNCTLIGNGGWYGGGAARSTLNNCTLIGNSASSAGGGAYYSTLNNCIAYYNSAPSGANYDSCTINYSCTTPLPSDGFGNFTAEPLFVDTNGWRNLRLQSDSPCINAGKNAYAAGSTDLDGRPRIIDGTVDLGAYEFGLPPTLTRPLPTQTVEEGVVVDFAGYVKGGAPLFYQWFLNDVAITAPSTNSCLEPVSSGTYTVVVTNVFGSVTSSPAIFSVIPRVDRTPVPGIQVAGEMGSVVNVDCTDSLASGPAWLILGSLSLAGPSEFYFDLTAPLPQQRFYRAWSTGASAVPAALDLHVVPAITLTGEIGSTIRVEGINQVGPIDAWFSLGTVTMTNTSQLYFDVFVIGQPPRLYRLVPVP